MSFLGWLFRAADLEHYKQGIAHFNAGEYEQAAARLEEALACSARHSAHHHLERFYAAEARARLGEALLAQGETDRAAAELRQAIELGQSYPDRLAMLARIEHLRGHTREALSLLERALALNPAYRAAQAERILCLDELDEHHVAQAALDGLAAEDPALAEAMSGAPETQGAPQERQALDDAIRQRLVAILEEGGEAKRRVRRAEAYELRGERQRALAELEDLAERYPDYPDVRLRLGRLLHRSGRLADARRHILRALEINPRYAEAHLEMGLLSLKRGEPEAALAQLAHAAQLAPAHPLLPLLRALGYLRNGSWDEAQRALREGSHAPAERVAALEGLMAWAAGDEECARLRLTEALEGNPGLGWAADALARLAEQAGDLAQARRVLAAAARLQPERSALRLSLARILHRTGRREESAEEIEAVLRHDPDCPAALIWKGRLLADRGALAAAERCLQQAVAQGHGAPAGWRELGRVQLRQDRPGEASQALAVGIESSGVPADAALDLALSHLRQGRAAAAREALARVDPEQSDHPLVRLLDSAGFVDDL
ncbi:MAG: tetratricopeptide repeat protein [Candidatus Eisenbacteria bacterium]|nr:tetratricopeptide repeat protein [Candidatus Eisenbacteria bacterium]